MAGLGLTNAVNAYASGKAWHDNQQQIEKQKKQQQIIDDANKAAANVFEASKAEWAINGAQGQYQPNDTTMFKAAEARSAALAKAGDWQNFMLNEAQVQKERIRVRANALQRYEQDGDIEALARTAYPSWFDGKEIVSTEVVKGGAPGGLKGAPSGPTVLRAVVRDSQGKESVVMHEPSKIVQMLKKSLIDPVASAEAEIKANAERARIEAEAAGKIKVEQVKGEEDRKTEAKKAEAALTKVGAEHTNAMALAGVNNEAAGRRTATTAAATRYAADKGLEGAKVRSEGDDGNKGLSVAQKWVDLAKSHYGKITGGLAGSNRIAGQDTLDLGAAAQRIYEANKGKLTELQALDAAAKHLNLVSPAGGLDAVLAPQAN